MKSSIIPIELPEILIITSYPPRKCGIATYSQDLIMALNSKFSRSLSIKVCALESGDEKYVYPAEVKFILNTSSAPEYHKLAKKINNDRLIKTVLIQHEFGFYKLQEKVFLQFLYELEKPVITAFHTVLPSPGIELKLNIKNIAAVCESIIVMTHGSFDLLVRDYDIPQEKISVIAHGTHLVQHLNKKKLKT